MKCQTGISPIRLSCAGRNPYAGQDKTDDGIVLYGADQVGKDEAGLKRWYWYNYPPSSILPGRNLNAGQDETDDGIVLYDCRSGRQGRDVLPAKAEILIRSKINYHLKLLWASKIFRDAKAIKNPGMYGGFIFKGNTSAGTPGWKWTYIPVNIITITTAEAKNLVVLKSSPCVVTPAYLSCTINRLSRPEI